MKKLILLAALLIGIFFIGCEKDIVPPPDDPELFTDITYEVIGSVNLNPLTVNYGDLKYSLPNYPDSLVWEVVTIDNVTVPWSKTVNTCTGHPVKIGVITAGKDRTMTFNIYDDGVLVATETFESNGFLWGGNLEYNIPSP
jgi:hypothetical protein